MASKNTKAFAERLAAQIVRYWTQYGCKVNAWIEREAFIEGVAESGYRIKTDMVNGLPADATAKTIRELKRRTRA